MIITAVLANVKRLYVDTAPFIYYVEENPHYIALMDAIIAHLSAGYAQGFCSVITLPEVLMLPIELHGTI